MRQKKVPAGTLLDFQIFFKVEIQGFLADVVVDLPIDRHADMAGFLRHDDGERVGLLADSDRRSMPCSEMERQIRPFCGGIVGFRAQDRIVANDDRAIMQGGGRNEDRCQQLA